MVGLGDCSGCPAHRHRRCDGRLSEGSRLFDNNDDQRCVSRFLDHCDHRSRLSQCRCHRDHDTKSVDNIRTSNDGCDSWWSGRCTSTHQEDFYTHYCENFPCDIHFDNGTGRDLQHHREDWCCKHHHCVPTFDIFN